VAADVLGKSTLQKQNIAPTASVIALSSKAAK
jgi:hypothetical protein